MLRIIERFALGKIIAGRIGRFLNIPTAVPKMEVAASLEKPFEEVAMVSSDSVGHRTGQTEKKRQHQRGRSQRLWSGTPQGSHHRGFD